MYKNEVEYAKTQYNPLEYDAKWTAYYNLHKRVPRDDQIYKSG